MDTILLCNDKRILNVFGIAVNFLIITALVAAQSAFVPIMARDMLANVPVLDTGQTSIEIMREVKDEVKSRNFDEEVRQKYPNALIADIDSGVKHIKMTKYYDGRPVKINVVEVDPKLAKDYTLTPALASDTLSNKKTITTIAKNTNSIIALNGTYFKPQTGVPLGTLMINEKLYTGPIYDRVAMGIFDDGYDIARIQLNASFGAGKNTVKVDNINQPRMLSTYVLAYTPDWGNLAAPTPKYGLQIAVSDNKISQISTAQLHIPLDGYVLAGPASLLNKFIQIFWNNNHSFFFDTISIIFLFNYPVVQKIFESLIKIQVRTFCVFKNFFKEETVFYIFEFINLICENSFVGGRRQLNFKIVV